MSQLYDPAQKKAFHATNGYPKSNKETEFMGLSEIEVALEATDDQRYIDKLIWVRDMLRELVAKGSHTAQMQ